tara:strand:+ start:74 stop:307 length:234 start_codon:yes stop_codon:yes gene_type:complete
MSSFSSDLDTTITYIGFFLIIVFVSRLLYEHVYVKELERHRIRKSAQQLVNGSPPDEDGMPFSPEEASPVDVLVSRN